MAKRHAEIAASAQDKLTGWLQDVSDAIAVGNGEGFVLPDPSVLAKGAMSAAAAAFTSLVNFAVRYLQAVAGKGQLPTYSGN